MFKRQFKFRVWAGAWKPPQMIAPENIRLSSRDSVQDAIDYANDSHFTLLQWTGLKDRKSKEIYEGDIVLHRFVGAELEVVYDIKTCAFVLKTKHQTLPMGQDTASLYEVTGNVFENRSWRIFNPVEN
jgi:uncharacterized phage protein (TIGR01671 family)